jgi:hypothetical protein
VSSALRAGVHYAWWYPSRWAPTPSSYGEFGSLARHLRYVRKTSRRLSRTLFHTMVRFGAGLEKRQAVLGRLVDIGAELFVMTAACVRAARMVKADPAERSPEELANAFCLQAKHRIEILFGEVFDNADVATYKVARRSMEGAYNWMESWIIPAGTPVGGPAGNGEGAAPLPERSQGVAGPAPASGDPGGASRKEAGTAAD